MSIPEKTLVVANLMALQTHPRYWGQDSLTWRPLRWAIGLPHDSGGGPDTRLAQENILIPEKGTFIPWLESARSCPGKKFAQVEFVATMAALFRNLWAEPVSKAGEAPATARKRVLEVVKDSNVELLLQMRNPDVYQRSGPQDDGMYNILGAHVNLSRSCHCRTATFPVSTLSV
ncbi:hypothetical protein N7G274_001137 [Stereocaulon virgatum]|uniref:Cytochrome P450 n=1 Tax=Stereocaulon virgatum TaxID=373712 RepID=A0ABR4APR8_9LECA